MDHSNPSSLAMHRLGEREILEQIVLHRGMASQPIVRRSTEEQELPVGERPWPIFAVHPIGRKHPQERDGRGRLDDDLPPVSGGEPGVGAQQIDVAAPMDISGTPRSSGYEQPRDNSMPDSSFASSFGSFMSPPDGHPGTAARSSPLRYSPFSARAPPR